MGHGVAVAVATIAFVALPATSRADGSDARPPPAATGPTSDSPPPGYYPPPPGGYWMPAPPPAESGTKRRSTGLMVTGIVFTALGGANAIAGAVMMAVAPRRCDVTKLDGATFEDGCSADPEQVAAGGFIMAAGGAMLAVGIPFWIVGAGKPSAKAPRPRAAGPTLLVGPRAAGVRWSF